MQDHTHPPFIDLDSRYRRSTVPLLATAALFGCTALGLPGVGNAAAGDVLFAEDTGDYHQVFSRPIDGQLAEPILLSSKNPSGSGAKLPDEGDFVTPDGLTVLFLESNGTYDQLLSRPIDASSSAALLSSEDPVGKAYAPRISPDGTTVVFSESTGEFGQLFSRSIDGTGSAVLLSGANPAGSAKSPRIAPVGGQVVFVENTGDYDQLFSRPIDGALDAPILLSSENPDGYILIGGLGNVISPDGSWVVFVERTGERDKFFSRPIDGSDEAPTLLSAPNPAAGVHAPYDPVSPVGDLVVYEDRVGAFFQLFSRAIDGSRPATLLSNPVPVDDARFAYRPFTPDGQTVLFQDVENQYYQIFSRRADGSEEAALLSAPNPLTNAYFDEARSVSPDGQTAIFFKEKDLYFQLFSRPFDGTGNPVLLSSEEPTNEVFVPPQPFTPDSSTVVFVDDNRVFSSPADGSHPPVQLSSVGAGIVATMHGRQLMGPDSGWVAFIQETEGGPSQVYSATIDGFNGPVLLSSSEPSGNAENPFVVLPEPGAGRLSLAAIVGLAGFCRSRRAGA